MRNNLYCQSLLCWLWSWLWLWGNFTQNRQLQGDFYLLSFTQCHTISKMKREKLTRNLRIWISENVLTPFTDGTKRLKRAWKKRRKRAFKWKEPHCFSTCITSTQGTNINSGALTLLKVPMGPLCLLCPSESVHGTSGHRWPRQRGY